MSARKKEYYVQFTTTNTMAEILEVFSKLSASGKVTNFSADETNAGKPAKEGTI